jgi:hypothetical protein
MRSLSREKRLLIVVLSVRPTAYINAALTEQMTVQSDIGNF